MENTKLTYSDFKRIEKLKLEADRLLKFATVHGDMIEISHWSSYSQCMIGTGVYNGYVVNAAQKEARRLALQIQDEIDSIMQSDEKETKEETSQQDVHGSLPGLLRKLFRR